MTGGAPRKENTKKFNFTIRLSEDEFQWLQSEAEREIRPIGQMIRWIIAEYRNSQVKNSSNHEEA